jgi:hypothetical protein
MQGYRLSKLVCHLYLPPSPAPSPARHAPAASPDALRGKGEPFLVWGGAVGVGVLAVGKRRYPYRPRLRQREVIFS